MWSKPIKNNSGKITIEVSEVQILSVVLEKINFAFLDLFGSFNEK
jgi:hypothetical protein